MVMSFLMLLNGLVSAYILRDRVEDPGSDAYGPPKIIAPTGTTVNAELGKSLKLTCQAITGYPDKFSTIIYWLANQEFIEDVFENSRVKEGQEIRDASWRFNYKQTTWEKKQSSMMQALTQRLYFALL
ncbi:uncharacterized protein LOC132209781 isoform X4 [Stegostoma tigrinum]|uniref:uncharacterized protein LOC132209781 isoform X4 n=1 Tax=Stegostoma tigrinum TaxID=3053191 RepID=UPI00286FD849|nr:uncharacterized protein LOC132209781 isoform X4 [Stegostoma tigrinum]